MTTRGQKYTIQEIYAFTDALTPGSPALWFGIISSERSFVLQHLRDRLQRRWLAAGIVTKLDTNQDAVVYLMHSAQPRERAARRTKRPASFYYPKIDAGPFQGLTEQEKQVLQDRISRRLTFKQCGANIGRSIERARQVYATANRKLRHWQREDLLHQLAEKAQ